MPIDYSAVTKHLAEIDSASIGMNGSFNPAIFQPHWLAAQKLIRPEEAKTAKITTIQPELADFSTEWFQLQVLQNRFLLLSADPRQFSPLRDLAAAIFSLLPHTPITKLGMHRLLHFQMRNKDQWHKLGHILAPKEPWSGILDRPGLLNVSIQGYSSEVPAGTAIIKLQPSTRVEFGVYIEMSEEFGPPSEGEAEEIPWINRHLQAEWDITMKFFEDSASRLLELVEG